MLHSWRLRLDKTLPHLHLGATQHDYENYRVREEIVNNKVDVLFHLAEARSQLEELMEHTEAGKLECDPMVLRHSFNHFMYHVCLAWHQRQMSSAQIDALEDEAALRLAASVPDWGLNYELVDVQADWVTLLGPEAQDARGG